MATFNKSDIEFILTQIKMAEAGQPPVSPHLSFGLRQVNGENNNSVPGNGEYGSADQLFLRVGTPVFQNADIALFGPPSSSSYAQTSGNVFDADPRTISNLISDQSSNNPAAIEAAKAAADALGTGYQHSLPGADGQLGTADDVIVNPGTPTDTTIVSPITHEAISATNLFINNITPDAGLSAPFNTWMTLFGQFFDHGLDFANKGGNGTVFIPLKADDPLYVPGGHANFMVLTRATMDMQAGADGIAGTADDVIRHEATNSITPFVDQNQTYTSHPSHQVFLREYVMGVDGKPHATGRLLDSSDGNHHMPTWADVKAQAKNILGIELRDTDVADVPLLATDEYGNFIPGKHGLPQMVFLNADRAVELVEGDLATPVSTALINIASNQLWKAASTGHAFLNDIAHSASPFSDTGAVLPADSDTVLNVDAIAPVRGTYDNELLDKHYIAGDGRANENIGLTAVHEVFHSEHNRLLEQTKALVVTELLNGDMSFANEWLMPGTDLSHFTGTQAEIDALQWNGERLFQVAKFGTETQYQHLVFEEFARKIAPTIHVFGNNDIHLDPAITAEFAHAVYRFGHSMLDENLNRYTIGADGTPVLDADGHPVLNEIGLIDAFTNPLAYANQGANAAGEIVLGSVNQVGNEIDEFVTDSLRNNLLGLPLDLAAINIARGRETGVPPINLLRNEIYSQNHDTALKPYESWDEFGQFLKHSASLINFVAAYGTHQAITNATTLIDKRAAALDLVSHSIVGSEHFDQDAFNFMHSQGLYANNNADARAIHDASGAIPTWSTGSVTGLDHVDLWIGGLAEKQNLFGGLLGSTFNFVFETQMEALQDADRLYYLPRIEGMHWSAEIEGNSFADLIMRNTGTHHLSASIFLTPEYTVEASTIDKKDPSTWLHNPETGKLLVDVMNDGTIRFLGDDNFFGNTMVLGGTEGDDRLLAGQADDDTVWGDGGNDFIDGGNGNDFLFGGTGDDTISDSAGDDTIHGDDGNDIILAGFGDDIIFGNDGNDFVDGGQGIDAITGGLGNDILLGGEDDDEIVGNEGDDWLEGGAGGDLMVGDGAAPTGQVPLFSGNDVLIGGAQGDRMQGFTGDDIMLGEGGFDRFEGHLGYDWASYEQATHGVSVDMNLREFIPDPLVPAGDAVRDLFKEVEAVSGSAYGDVIQGTDNALTDVNNELINVNLIDGLSQYFETDAVAFSDGNILLGGAGSDFLTGRGGNDIIDGDAALHVSLTSYGPGGQIIREITNDGQAGDIDTAVYLDVMGNYQWTPLDPTDPRGLVTITHTPVAGAGGVTVNEGTDTLYHIERLQFADGTVDISGNNTTPFGAVIITGDTNLATPLVVDPVVGAILSVDLSTLEDIDNVPGLPFPTVHLQWQVQDIAKGRWIDIAGATSSNFAPSTFQTGEALRVQATYVDGKGITERMFSAATSVVAPAPTNLAPTVIQQQALTGLPDTSAKSGAEINLFLPLTTVFTDDHTAASQLIYTAKLANGATLDSLGLHFATIPDGAGGVTGGRVTGTVPGDFLGALDIRVTATDQGGLSTTDTFAINVLPNTINGTEGNDTLTGTAGMDRILGKGGDDIIDALGGNDTVDGGAGNDRISGGDGNDTLIGGLGNDTLDGGVSVDSMTGGAGNDTYVVDSAGDVVIEVASEGADTVKTTLASYLLGANVENLVFTGSGNFAGTGNGLANALTGGAGDDTLIGGGGEDVLTGGAGNDTSVYSGAISDYVLSANAGVITVRDVNASNGDEGTDSLTGIETLKFADHTLSGMHYIASNPDLIPLLGTNAEAGLLHYIEHGVADGRPTDTFDPGWYLAKNADLTAAFGNDQAAATWHFLVAGFAEGRPFDPNGDDVLNGSALNDLINGHGGNDYLRGGAGNDVLDGDTGIDIALFSGNAADYVVTTNAGVTTVRDINITNGDEGTDTLTHVELLKFSDTWISGDPSITLPDPLRYVASNPDLIPLLGTDAEAALVHYIEHGIADGRPTDTFDPGWYLAKNADLTAAFGNDQAAATWHFLVAGFAEGRPFDPNGDDVLNGSALNDLINGHGGNDYLRGGAGNDVLDGDTGIDIALFSGNAADYVVTTNAGVTTVRDINITNGDEGTDTLTHVELLKFSDTWISGDPSITLPDPLRYVASNPDLIPLLGTDAEAALVHYIEHGIADGRPTDTFDPGWYLAKNADLTAAFGNDQAAATWHFLVAGFAEGRPFDPNGDDVLNGSALNDLINGHGGNDYLRGGAGNDVLDGDTGIDIALFSGNAADYVVTTNAGVTTVRDINITNGDEGTDTLTHVELLKFSDTWISGDPSITLPDPLRYVASNPDLIPLLGTDAEAALVHYIEHGIADGRPTDTFDPGWYLAKNADLTAAFGNDQAAATWHFLVAGFAEGRPFDPNGDDVLNGSALNDLINGHGGNDVINGNGGNDTLTGGVGAGADIFTFSTPLNASSNVDTITDFIAGNDILALEHAIFSMFTTGETITAHLVAAPDATAHNATDFVLYDTNTGNLYYDSDGSGSQAAIQFATLNGAPTITADNFLIV